MMKKFIIPATIVAMMGVGGYFGRQALNNTPSGMSELELANAEALSEDGEGTNPSNTGPGELVDCSEEGKARKLCMCSNPNPCTETDCF